LSPFIKTHNYINFKYDEPIDGIKITGIFKPEEWSCHSTFSGEVTLTFTKLSDGKSFEFNLKDVNFIDSSVCEESQSNEENEVCIIRKNIILKYDKNLNFFDKNDDKLEFTTQPLSIIDIDFDDKKEIVIARPCE
jgi:hypothetical protein